jgi:tetratricopeptide (TPR) repeat protein
MTPVSPLFAVHAEQLLHSGNPSEAIELCLNGLLYYSDYPAAYAVAARAYLAVDNQLDAIRILDKGLFLFPLHKTLLRINDEILHPLIESSSSVSLQSSTVDTFSENELLESNDVYQTQQLENGESLTTIGVEANTTTTENETAQSDVIQFAQSERKYSPLRIIETIKAPSNFIGSIKATSVNLISGLEFATLRIENGYFHPLSKLQLPEPPPFPTFLRKPKLIETPSDTNDVLLKEDEVIPQKLTPLEELAARLEKVRIPVAYQEIARSNNPSQVVPAMITETMARIYEKQGAYSEAIKAYQILARRTPEKLEFYEQKIRDVVELIEQEEAKQHSTE